MFKRKLTQADIFLIAANLLPVVGSWFWGWNPKEVFIVYCLETIIIGSLTLLLRLSYGVYTSLAE